jgi:hypothetical protein
MDLYRCDEHETLIADLALKIGTLSMTSVPIGRIGVLIYEDPADGE